MMMPGDLQSAQQHQHEWQQQQQQQHVLQQQQHHHHLRHQHDMEEGGNKGTFAKMLISQKVLTDPLKCDRTLWN